MLLLTHLFLSPFSLPSPLTHPTSLLPFLPSSLLLFLPSYPTLPLTLPPSLLPLLPSSLLLFSSFLPYSSPHSPSLPPPPSSFLYLFFSPFPPPSSPFSSLSLPLLYSYGTGWGIDGYMHMVRNRNTCGIGADAGHPIV